MTAIWKDAVMNGSPVAVQCMVSELVIDDGEIWKCMGYGDSEPDGYVLGMVESLKSQALSVCRPRAGFRLVEGRCGDHGLLTLGGISFHPRGIIYNCLKGAEVYAVLLASVGPEMDGWISAKSASGDVMESFIADALGSVFAEAIVSAAVGKIGAMAGGKGWKVSNSYSPGYCGWDVGEQRGLFSLLPGNFCGVTLTESSLMLPIKSVSCVLAVGPDVERKPYGCDICRKPDCYKRRLEGR